jgi:hypothetical protein
MSKSFADVYREWRTETVREIDAAIATLDQTKQDKLVKDFAKLKSILLDGKGRLSVAVKTVHRTGLKEFGETFGLAATARRKKASPIRECTRAFWWSDVMWQRRNEGNRGCKFT